MIKITESEIEDLAINLLEKQGYQYIYAPTIAPDSETPERERFEDVLLLERLRKAVARINTDIPADAREDAIRQVRRLNSPELISNNEAFHRMLTEGINVSYRKEGADRGDLSGWLILTILKIMISLLPINSLLLRTIRTNVLTSSSL
nr:type I restriction endonuclease [Methanosarcina horonobensis]